MASTRSTLASIESHLLESMGSRAGASPARPIATPHPRDIGRRPLPDFGTLPIDQLVPDPAQPRTDFSPEALRRLADSIRDQGQLAPIRVRWSDDLGKWVIIAGERRWQAAKLAGFATIECYFQTGELSPSEVLEQQLIENLLREDLNPVEQARAFASLMQLNRLERQAGRRERSACPPPKSAGPWRCLRLPEDIQQRVERGEIPTRAAYELSKLED